MQKIGKRIKSRQCAEVLPQAHSDLQAVLAERSRLALSSWLLKVRNRTGPLWFSARSGLSVDVGNQVCATGVARARPRPPWSSWLWRAKRLHPFFWMLWWPTRFHSDLPAMLAQHRRLAPSKVEVSGPRQALYFSWRPASRRRCGEPGLCDGCGLHGLRSNAPRPHRPCEI